MSLEIRERRYDHPDAVRLIAEVQAEYVVRYGGEDSAPVDPDEFAPPLGHFAVGYLDGAPVAMGGWRRHEQTDAYTGWAAPVAEIKRMYVAERTRGMGFARQMLAHLEQSAQSDGVRWLVLETGQKQPEAIALYKSAGYLQVPKFGHYREFELSLHLGKNLI